MWWLLILVLLLGSAGVAFADNSGPAPTDTPSDGGTSMQDPATFTPGLGIATGITSDPATWPGDESDPIWKCCHAIGFAEGAHVAGSNPDRLNNPGDLSDGSSTFGSEFHSGSNVTHFPDKATGWQRLYSKVANIVNGGSSVYSPDMTWTQIAQKWAGNWQNWVNNVTRYCGVSPTDRFGDFFGV